MKKSLIIFFVLIIILGIASCKNPLDMGKKYGVYRMDYYGYLDTVSNIVIEYKKDKTSEEKVKEELLKVKNILLEIETTFSTETTIYMKEQKINESLLMKVNANSGKDKVVVSDLFITVLKQAIEISNITKGMFNPSIGALTSLWGISKKAEYCNKNQDDKCKIPLVEEINKAISLIDYHDIEIDETTNSVYLKKQGMQLDLGAIVKGYVADIIMDFLQNNDYTYIAINLGGNILTKGKSYLVNNLNDECEIVPIGIENTNYDIYKNSILMEINEENVSVVTSGLDKRYIEVWDEQTKSYQRYHHILDPITGFPVQNEILSTTIIGPSSMLCDAFSTGVFLMGVEKGNIVLKEHNLKGIIVTKERNIYIIGDLNYTLSKGLNEVYNIINL